VRNANGWLYVVTGTATLLAGMFAPVIFGHDRHTAGYREDVLHRSHL
jgi:hypothetical protein